MSPVSRHHNGERGNGRHLALACKVYGVRTKVAGTFNLTFGTGGPDWAVRHSANTERYDVVGGGRPDRAGEAAQGTGQAPKGGNKEAIGKADAEPTTGDNRGNPELPKKAPASEGGIWAPGASMAS